MTVWRKRRGGGALRYAPLLALVTTTCGLPNVVFFVSPIEVTSVGTITSRTVRFQHAGNGNDSDDFLGYELYYKLYTEGDRQAEIDRRRVNTDLPPTESGLTGLGFRRFVVLDNTTTLANERPHIGTREFDRSAAVVFSVDLRDPSVSNVNDITVSWTNAAGTPVTKLMRRNHTNSAVRNPGDVLSFWTTADYENSHSDYRFGPTPRRLTILVAVLGYGIAPDTLNQVFSRPLALDPSTLVIRFR